MKAAPPVVAALWLCAETLGVLFSSPCEAQPADPPPGAGAPGAPAQPEQPPPEVEPKAEEPKEEEPEPEPEPEPKGPTKADIARREAAHQAAIEVAEPRPPLREIELPEEPKWERHIEIGGDFALVLRPLASAEIDNGVAYDPAPAWGLHLRWRMYSFLRFHAYFVDAHHSIQIPQGALVAKTARSIGPDATFEDASVASFVFGARLAPTWEITDTLRLWLGAGVGWGRFEFPVMVVNDAGARYEVRERDGVFVEFPISVGASYDIIDRWLAIELEVTAAPVTGQSGKAHSTVQAVDADGNLVDVGGLSAINASFVNTLGLSLIL